MKYKILHNDGCHLLFQFKNLMEYYEFCTQHKSVISTVEKENVIIKINKFKVY